MDRHGVLVLIVVGIWCLSLQCVLCRPHHHRESCKVKNIPVQENLDVEQLSGKWFDVARTTLHGEGPFLQSGVGLFSARRDGALQFVYSGKDNGKCTAPITATGFGTSTPGKLFLAFENAVGSFLRGSFWVVRTDYTRYALMYGCNQLRPNGLCRHGHQLVYLVSRTPQLPPGVLLEAETAIQDVLCVDISQLTVSTHQEDCLRDDGFLNLMFGDGENTEAEGDAVEGEEEEQNEVEGAECAALTDCDVEALGCAHGLKRDAAGCDTCACHACSAIMCPMRCEHGFAQDEFGCNTCACHTCSPVLCLMHCEHGFAQDERHCNVCSCAPPTLDTNAVAPEFRYDIQEHKEESHSEGQDAGENETGEDKGAKQDCPARSHCRMACEFGFLRDERGCDTCECRPPCAVPMCANRCEHGYRRDEFGCDTCDCIPVPAAYQHVPEPAACRPVLCHVNCSSGFQKDEHGCDMCRCEGCPSIQCTMYCPHGFKQNEEGCQVCECNGDDGSHGAEAACRVGDVAGLEHIDYDKLSGEWRLLASVPGQASARRSSYFLRLERTETGLTSLYREVWENGCGPTLGGTCTPQGNREGEFYVSYGPKSGVMKILYVTDDYQHVVTYHCLHTRPDGSCGHQEITMLGRNGEFSEEVKEELVSRVPAACAQPSDFVQVSTTRECHIRPSTEPVPSCKISDLRSGNRVDWTHFEGRWYSVAKLYSRDVDQSGEYLAKRTQNGRVSLKYRGSRNGICRDISEAMIAPVEDGTGAFTVFIGKVRADGMLIYHDRNLALYYECGEVTESGECKKGAEYLEVMFREKHAPGYLASRFGRLLQDFCVDVTELVPIEHDVSCPVRDICRMSDIPSQENFNSTAFSGTWHSVAILRQSGGWDHVTARAIAVSDGDIVLHYTGTKDGECQASSTAVLSVMDPAHPADFLLHSGFRTAHVKVVYTDYEVAVIYECQRMGDDNKCEKGQEYLDVLSRHAHGFTGADLRALHAHLGSACAQEDDMQLSTHHVDCPLTNSPASCVVADLPLQQNFSVEMVTGRWYVSLSDPDSARTIKPSQRDVTLLPDGHLLDAVVSLRDGECVDHRTLVGKSDNGWTVGEYHLIKGKFVKPLIKVAYADAETLITYFCNEEDEHGMCVTGRNSVIVSTRAATISDAKRAEIRPVLSQLCIDPDVMVAYNNSVECDLAPPPSVCTVESTPILKKFQMKEAMGKWYVLWRTRYSRDPDALVLELLPGEDDHVIAKFTGLSQRYCMEPTEFELTQQHEPEEAQLFIKFAENVNGVWRVVTTDYTQHMMLYECGLIGADGACAPGQGSVQILGRSAEPLHADVETALMKRLEELCIDAAVVERVPHEVSCEQFSNDCESRPVPSQDNFNTTAFAGTWYSFARLGTSTPWNSGAVNFTFDAEGRVLARFMTSRQGTCVETSGENWTVGTRTSEWTSADPTRWGRIVFTDYDNVAVTLQCSRGNEDGTCPREHRHIDVMTRNFEGPRPGTKKLILPVGLQLCIRKRDLRKTAKPVRCDFVEEDEQCRINQLHFEEDFNPYTLLGEWYSYARRKGTIGIDSSKFLITRGDPYGSKLLMFYAGLRKGHCMIGGESLMEARTDEPNKFTLTYEESGRKHTGELTVLFADDQHALIYECYNVLSDGSCDKADTFVEIMTRHKRLYPEARQKIIDALSAACFTFDDLVLSAQDADCPISIPGKRCEFYRTRTHPHFDYRSIMGKTWFTRARLIPDEPLWPGIGLIHFAHEGTNKIQLAWAEHRNSTDQCSSGTNLKQRLNSDAFLFEIWKKNFVFTKLLFADDNLLVTYDCVVPEYSDRVEQCARREIGVHHRNRAAPLTQPAINFIKDIVRTQTCLDPEALEVLHIPKPCAAPPKEQLGRLCYQDTITAMENLDINKLSGLWFQVARAHAADDIHWDAGVFHLHIENPSSIRIHFTGRSNYKEKTCMPVFTVDAYPDARRPAYMVYSSERFMGKNGLMKIIHVDDDVLIIYECLPGGHQDNGLCKRHKEHVEIYARRTHVNSRTFQKVNQILHKKTCFTADDLVTSNRTAGCVLPEYDQFHHTATECKVSDYPAVENLNFQAFAGLWYEVERTQYHDAAADWAGTAGHRGKLWEAAVVHYDPVRMDVFNYSHSGYTPRDGICQGPFIAHTHPAPGEAEHSGSMHFFPGHTQAHGGPWTLQGTHKVVWTDYEEALIYICLSEKDDGTCRQDTEFVSVLSRSRRVAPDKLAAVHQVVRENLCIDISDFVTPHSDYERCIDTLGFEHEVEHSGEEAELDACANRPRCLRACEHGFATDESGCPICECLEPSTDDGSGSGSGSMEAVLLKGEMGSGADEMAKSKSDGSGAEEKEENEEELINEIEKVSTLGGH